MFGTANMPTKLLSEQATNGSSVSFENFAEMFTVLIAGVFGGASVALQCSPDAGVTWLDTGLLATSNLASNAVGARGLLYRLTVTNATASTSINAWVASK